MVFQESKGSQAAQVQGDLQEQEVTQVVDFQDLQVSKDLQVTQELMEHRDHQDIEERQVTVAAGKPLVKAAVREREESHSPVWPEATEVSKDCQDLQDGQV